MNLGLGDKKIDVSIIIVNWNTDRLLRQCIESLHLETREVIFEIIVVDNGSSDGSVEMVKNRFPGVKLILNSTNHGFARANNQGIAISTGRYVCLVNSDIIALDRCVDKMLEYMDNHDKIGALGPKTVGNDFRFRKNCRRFPSLRSSLNEALGLDNLFPRNSIFQGRLIDNIPDNIASEVDVLSGCFLMVRREVVQTVGLLDERFFIYGEDTDWCYRIKQAGWQVVFYPQTAAIHIGGASSAVKTLKFQIELLKSDFLYWKKHHQTICNEIFKNIKFLHCAVRYLYFAFKKHLSGRSSKDLAFELERNLMCMRWIVQTQIGGKKSELLELVCRKIS